MLIKIPSYTYMKKKQFCRLKPNAINKLHYSDVQTN